MKILKIIKDMSSIINVFLIIGLISFLIYHFYFENQIILENKVETNSDEKTNDDYYVEVKGAINTPGVYKLTNDNIINDLINLANGFKEDAYTKNINLARKVQDAMVIYVYTNDEYNNLEIKTNSITPDTTCICENITISACENTGVSIIEKKDTKQEDNKNISSRIVVSNKTKEKAEIINESNVVNEIKNEISNENKNNEINYNANEVIEEENHLVNINTDSLEKLMTIPGIGESKAKNIISYREENGLFNETKDIINVSGISEKTYDKIKDYITV